MPRSPAWTREASSLCQGQGANTRVDPREAEPLADRKQALPAPRALCGVRPSLEGPQFTPRDPRLFLSQGERPPLWSQPQHAPLPCRPSCWQSWSSCPSPCCPPQVLGGPSRSRPDT